MIFFYYHVDERHIVKYFTVKDLLELWICLKDCISNMTILKATKLSKTTSGSYIAISMLLRNIPPLFFSLPMKDKDVVLTQNEQFIVCAFNIVISVWKELFYA